VARTTRVMTMITNVQQAVYPLLLICSVFGIGICSPKKIYLNILYNFIVWTSYGCIYYYAVTGLKAEIWFQSVSNMIHIRIGVFSTITSIIMCVYRDKVFICRQNIILQQRYYFSLIVAFLYSFYSYFRKYL